VEVVISSFVTAAEASQERGQFLVVVSVPLFEHCEHHYRYKLHVYFLGFLKDCLNSSVGRYCAVFDAGKRNFSKCSNWEMLSTTVSSRK
jgi:hypothetical protein